MPTSGQRRLAAIMFTDIVGYSSVMQEDEARGKMLRERHRKVFEQCSGQHGGRIIQYFGDGTLSIFDSAVAAVECAVDMQRNLRTYPQVPLRIGIHLGDIHYDDTEVYGHGVNTAARIEPLCNPGGIFISHKVNDEVQGHPWLITRSLGTFKFKNIGNPLELFAIEGKDVTFPSTDDIERARQQALNVVVAEAAERSEAIKRFNRESRRRKFSRMGNWAAIVLVVAMLGIAFAKWVSFPLPGSSDDDRRTGVAVLPFVNMSASADNDYFSDGMTEDILTLLSRIDGLRVTSRTSVMQYKNTTKSTKQIARELDVDHILEGSVRRDGDQVRITAQLIDADSDAHLWAETYDADLTSIFAVQSQVAEDIAKQLKKTLSQNDRDQIIREHKYDVTAYDLYLKGLRYYREYNPEDNDRAIAYFRGALQIEPEYPYAFAGLGDAFAQKSMYEGGKTVYLDTSIMMSSRAIEIDPSVSEGHKALGLGLQYKGEEEAAAKEYRMALELDPYNDMASNNLGVIERKRGNYAEAARWVHKTYEINTGVPTSAAAMAELYMTIGDEEKAEGVVDKALDVHPEAPELRFLKGILRLRENDPEGAIEQATVLIRNEPEMSKGYELMGSAYMDRGDWNNAADWFDKASSVAIKPADSIRYEAEKTIASAKANGRKTSAEDWQDLNRRLRELVVQNPEYKGLETIIHAAIDADTGDKTHAIRQLEVVAKQDWDDMRALSKHPVFEPLKADPEFRELLRGVELRYDSIRIVVHRAINDPTES